VPRDYDHGYAGNATACGNAGYLNACPLEVGSELSAERIITQATYESHGIAEPRHGDGLIRAFSAGMNLKVGCDDGLAYSRHSLSYRYQVCIDAADDDNWLLRRQCVSPQNNVEGLPMKILGRKRPPSSRTGRR
jgi:hypothetical protein